MSFFDGSRDWSDYPIVLGHEGAGVVLECGPGVVDVQPGDHVIPVAIPECGQCPACRSRKTNLCDLYFRPTPRRPFSMNARAAGITHFIDASQAGTDTVGMIRELSGGGADYSFECVGDAGILRQAVECTRIGWGTTVMLGVLPGTQELELRPRLIQEGRRLMGSYLGNVKTRTELPHLVDLYLDGRLRLESLISHRIGLEQIGHGFELLESGQARRVVIDF